jgi:hypothetical protein
MFPSADAGPAQRTPGRPLGHLNERGSQPQEFSSENCAIDLPAGAARLCPSGLIAPVARLDRGDGLAPSKA